MADDCSHSWEMIPPWGSLPIEQYLVRNWSHSATDAPSQQRRRLLNRFLELDEIPEEYVSLDESLPRTLTPEEIDTILKPWRSDNDLRRKAYYMSKDNVLVFLRTHYNPHDDGKLKGWIHKNDLFEENAWWACLNDPYLFNFGPDWQRVYEIMPEVAGHVDRKRRSDDPSKLKHFRASSARSLQTRDQECLHGWRESLVKMTGELAKPPPNVTFATYIVIADQEAFQTGRLRLFCLDNGRKIVWEPRVELVKDQGVQWLKSDTVRQSATWTQIENSDCSSLGQALELCAFLDEGFGCLLAVGHNNGYPHGRWNQFTANGQLSTWLLQQVSCGLDV